MLSELNKLFLNGHSADIRTGAVWHFPSYGKKIIRQAPVILEDQAVTGVWNMADLG